MINERVQGCIADTLTIMKKFIVLTLLILGTLQSYAQFSYSIKAGWSWPDIHNETLPGHNMILA